MSPGRVLLILAAAAAFGLDSLVTRTESAPIWPQQQQRLHRRAVLLPFKNCQGFTECAVTFTNIVAMRNNWWPDQAVRDLLGRGNATIHTRLANTRREMAFIKKDTDNQLSLLNREIAIISSYAKL